MHERRRGQEPGTHLGRDELEAGELPPCLLLDDVVHLRINLREGRIQALVLHQRISQSSTTNRRRRLTKSGVLAIVLGRGTARRREEARMGRERRRNIEKNSMARCYKQRQICAANVPPRGASHVPALLTRYSKTRSSRHLMLPPTFSLARASLWQSWEHAHNMEAHGCTHMRESGSMRMRLRL